VSILDVENLSVSFPVRSPFLRRTVDFIEAVRDVTFSVQKGKTLGIVGESGSGKSTLGKAILNLVPISGGLVRFEKKIISQLPEREFRPFRRKIQMVFQDPFGSLNPRWSVWQIINEPLQLHFPQLRVAERRLRVIKLLEIVGLNSDMMRRFPHEFSGGQRQRVGIARALAVEPELIVCDEPVSALDVSVQAQIVNLLQDLQDALGLTYLFIGHDLAVVEHISHETVVMHQGRIVEAGEFIYQNPQEEYTRKLLASVPAVS